MMMRTPSEKEDIVTATATPDFQLTKDPSTDVSVEGTWTFDDSTEMTLDASGAAHIIGLLTNLYSDANSATLREITSNAYDAHRAIGNDAPIEVTLPSALDPNFIVQDYGAGMSAEDIRNIYARYGASTKRDTLDQIGAFGLGAKAPLALVSQFTLTSIKDGYETNVIVSMGENGVGNVNILSEKPTDAHSGTTVSIPIPNASAFLRNVNSFFETWKPGTVLVDGHKPASIYDKASLSTTDSETLQGAKFLWLDSQERSYGYNHPFYVSIAGLTYKVDPRAAGLTVDTGSWRNTPDLKSYYRRRGLPFNRVIVEVPIGAVDLTPAREELSYSPRTKAVLAVLHDEATEHIAPVLEDKFKNLSSRREAIQMLNRWGYVINDLKRYGGIEVDATWNGEEIVSVIELQNEKLSYSNNRGRRTHERYVHLSVQAEHFYTVLPEEVNAATYVRSFLKEHLDTDELHLQNFLLFNSKPTNKWLTEHESFTFVEWDEVVSTAKAYQARKRAEAKRNRTSNPAAAKRRDRNAYIYPSATYVRRDGHDSLVAALGSVDVADLKGTIYYTAAAQDDYATNLLADSLRGFMQEGDILIKIPTNRKTAAFLKRLPGEVKATHVNDLIDAKFKEEISTVSDEVRWLLAHSNHYLDAKTLLVIEMASNHADKINDKHLVKMSKDVDKYTKLLDKYQFLLSRRATEFSSRANVKQITANTFDVDRDAFTQSDFDVEGHIAEHYPLLAFARWSREEYIEHSILYINAVVAQEQA